MTTEELEKAIGERPVNYEWNSPAGYYLLVLEWEQKARQIETARAERWKKRSIENMKKYCHDITSCVKCKKKIEQIDNNK